MKLNLKGFIIMALASVSIEVLVTSCIRESLPNINVDVIDIQPSISGSGIVKTTKQEGGYILYAEMAKTDVSNLDLDVSVSPGATWSYVEVKFDTTFVTFPAQKIYVPQTDKIDTTVVGELPIQRDFRTTQYIRVTAEAEGLNPEDATTRAGFNKFGGLDSNNHMYKIWSVNILPAGIPTSLTFDNWYVPSPTKGYEHPFEYVIGSDGQKKPAYIWSSTNNSIAIMYLIDQYTYKSLCYGAASTTDTYNGQGKALLLTTNDIFHYDTSRRFLTGCLFLGDFDGSDSNELTCTHIGIPFNDKPESLKFWYKYDPKTIESTGKPDQAFIKAVLFKTDDNVKYLTGKTIQNNDLENIVAYAEFYPDEKQDSYVEKDIPFTYIRDINETDLKNWKYSLGIYLASSKGGFTFVGAKDTKLYIDNMEIKCK